MRKYQYTSFSINGSKVFGVVDAKTESDAVKLIAAKGETVMEVVPVTNSTVIHHKKGGGTKALKLNTIELSKLFRGLSLLLEAEFSFDDSMSIAIQTQSSKKLKQLLVGIREMIAEGSSIAAAFEQKVEMSSGCKAMLMSGEQTGCVNASIEKLAQYYSNQADFKKTILESLAYPVFLICLLIIVLVLLSLQLVPALEPIFSETGSTPPFLISALGAVGEFIESKGIIILVLLFAVLVFLLLEGGRKAAFKALSGFLSKLPWVGSYWRRLFAGRYLRMLSVLVESKVPLIGALQLSATVSENLQPKLIDVSVRVSEGASLGKSFQNAEVFDDYIVSIVSMGEASNRLAFSLDQAASLIEDKSKSTMDRVLAVFSPTITIAIGLLVGGLVISVMTALLSLNDVVLQ